MDRSSLKSLLEEILEIDEVDPDTGLEDQGWDSLSRLAFIAEIDERLGLEIDADELAKAETMRDLEVMLNRTS